jgi:Uncharacterized protein conserved in bacteria (DUF2188)
MTYRAAEGNHRSVPAWGVLCHDLQFEDTIDSSTRLKGLLMADYNVTKNPSGGWDAKREGGSRASSHHDRQSEAYDAARDLARNSGGGEVRIHGTDGKIRNSNTIGKPDPDPPRDTKH